MHIKQLECFVFLAETLNYARTAELLYITQPTVTHQIKTLEDELQFKLFIRNKRKVELTKSGESFYRDIKDILIKTNIAISRARNYSLTFNSNISIGYEGNVEVKYLSDILNAFKNKFPDVHIYLKIADFREKTTLFNNQNFDLIFTVNESLDNINNIGYCELFKSKFVCVLPKNHLLASKSLIKLEELKSESLVLLNPLKCPKEMIRIQERIQSKYPESIAYFCDEPLVGYTMIKGGLGIAVMPDFVCPDDNSLAIIPTDISEEISYGIAWHKAHINKEIKGFISIAKHIYMGNNL